MGVHVEDTADGPLVSWDAPAWDGGADDVTYRVYRDGAIVADGVLAREYLDVSVGGPGMSASVSHSYQVSAVNEAGEGPMGSDCLYGIPPNISPDTCVGIVIAVAFWLIEKVLCTVDDITDISC